MLHALVMFGVSSRCLPRVKDSFLGQCVALLPVVDSARGHDGLWVCGRIIVRPCIRSNLVLRLRLVGILKRGLVDVVLREMIAWLWGVLEV